MGIGQYSPQFRPVGFPLLLAPFYAIFGNNIYTFELLNSILLILLCLLIQKFKRRPGNNLTYFLFLIVFAYNPSTLWLKQEVMPEIFFTLLLFTTLYVYIKKIKYHHILLPILIAALILVKYIGVVFILGYLLQALLLNIKTYLKYRKTLLTKSRIKKGLSLTILPLVIYYFINSILFRIPSGNENWFGNLFLSKDIFATIYSNLLYYKNEFATVFEQEVPHLINTVLKAAVVIFLLLGIILKLKGKARFIDYLFLVYLFVILCYPYSKGGYRFLFPIFPLLLIYIEFGYLLIIQIIERILPFFYIHVNWLLLFILLTYTINVKSIIKQTSTIEPGPQDKYFAECGDYISKNTTKADCFLFAKPWAFHLFADRKVVPLDGHASVSSFPACLDDYHVNYILACYNPEYNLYDPNLINLIAIQRNYHKVWNNSVFVLYRKD